MSVSAAPPPPHRRPLKIALLVGVVPLVLIVTAVLIPKYRAQIATVDNEHRWRHNSAPLRREVVWQPAVVVTPDAETSRSTSHIRPQITNHGNTLYFTLRTAEDNFEIVRSQRVDGGWSTPQRVAELNSAADDIGPVIRDDGKLLYLYSNRKGGFGGMDLYVSRQAKGEWSRPVNLGPKINSPAHEYDPAISPDSRRLFFSSNRSEQMRQQLAAGTYDTAADHWGATLRSDLGNRTFDLFAANFDEQSDRWGQAVPLERLNSLDHNEGAPFVSPDGAFLFFASDRPTARKETKNFDIYRVRLDQPGSVPENLGVGVNTPANEIEPCLTAAGFQLLFSRSDPHTPSRYALYQSTAKEVYHDRQWESSNWHAFTGAMASGTRIFFDNIWLLLLVLATLAVLVWLIRQIKVHRVAISGFLCAALLVHLFLVTGSFFVFFQRDIANRLKKMFEEEPVVATQVLFDSTAPNAADQPTFESVAQLEMPDSINRADLSRRASEVPDAQPIEFAKPQRIADNAPLASDVHRDLVVATVMIRDKPVEVVEIVPRAPVRRVQSTEQLVLQRTVAVEIPAIEPVQPKPNEIERQDLPRLDAPIEPISLERVDRESVPEAPNQPEPLPTGPLDIESIPVSVTLNRRALEPHPELTDADTPVPDEQIMSVKTQDLPTATSHNVELLLTKEMLTPALAQPEPLMLARQNASAPEPLSDELLVPLLRDNHEGRPLQDESASPLKRLASRNGVSGLPPPVATEAINFADETRSVPTLNLEPKVDLARPQRKQDMIHVSTLPINSTGAATPAESDVNEPRSTIGFSPDSISRRNPLASGLLLRRSTTASRYYADGNLNLQSLLLRRKLDEATKVEVVKQFGGNDQTLTTIRRGLSWIEQHQASDGHWGLHDFHDHCEGHKKCDGRGNSKSDTAATGLALLPFLGDGNTHKNGPYKDVVANGITWLVKNQKPDGNLFTGGQSTAFMYSQGIATIALCECYGMTGDESLREPAQRAIDFIVAAQDPKSGGWRYKPRERADTSVVGWQVMALKSGQMAELNVPEKTLKESERWLASVSGNKNRLGQFAYQGGRFNPAMTAEAILCLEYLGHERDSDELAHGVDYLSKNLPKKGRETSYYWYYGTQAMFHFQGDHWRKWNDAIHPLLIESQRKEGPMAGTWDPRDQWEKSGGRIYSTSLRVLMLEVYYRHLPIYQVIE